MLVLVVPPTAVLGKGRSPLEYYCPPMDDEADPCRLNRQLLTLTLALTLSPAHEVVPQPLYPGAAKEPALSEQAAHDSHEAGRSIFPASGAFGG